MNLTSSLSRRIVKNLSRSSNWAIVKNLTQVSGTLKSLVKLYADGTAITGFPSFISSLTNLQVLEIGRYQQTESSTWWTSIFQKQPQSLVSPSLASLQLLTELKVRNCNISEVCPDIGALSCLQHLDLSGNNFTKLPESLSQLSHLELLNVDGCKKLEVLPELPPSIERLYASGCTSLQEPPRLTHQHPRFSFDFRDCPKIFVKLTMDSQVSISQTRLIYSSTTSHASTNQLSFLVEYLCIQSKIHEFFSGSGGSLSTYKRLEIVFHGNRIPEWFRNKSKGIGSHDVKVELPPNWCNSKLKGYGICVVFKLKESYHRKLQGWPKGNRCSMNLDVFPIGAEVNIMKMLFKRCNWGWEEAKNFITFAFGCISEDLVEVKECGVRFVCEEEETEVLSMLQHLPPQTQPTAGLFELYVGEDFTSFFW